MQPLARELEEDCVTIRETFEAVSCNPANGAMRMPTTLLVDDAIHLAQHVSEDALRYCGKLFRSNFGNEDDVEYKRKQIEGYFHRETDGNIRTIPRDFRDMPQESIILSNGVYMRVDWAVPFRRMRQRKLFQTTAGPCPVEMLQLTNVIETFYRRSNFQELAPGNGDLTAAGQYANEYYQAFKLPMKMLEGYAPTIGKRLVAPMMLVIAPETHRGLRALEDVILTQNQTALHALLRNFAEASERKRIMVELPKLQIRKTRTCLSAMRNMDHAVAGGNLFGFHPQLNNMIQAGNQPYISRFEERVAVAINEHGVGPCASITTGVADAEPDEPESCDVHVSVTNPFMFIILDNLTTMHMVVGRYVNPDDRNE